jgi:signal transduction histidine kinase
LTINLNLAQLGRSAGIHGKRARQVLAETRDTVRDLSREIRSLSYLLHPPLLDELGLASAIEEYVKGFSQRSGIRFRFEMSSDVGRMSKESEMALFRIVQEALGNIQKHSGSTTGRIRLTRGIDEIILDITDAGHGMVGENSRKRRASSGTLGVGILGMRERMRQLGGRLEITSGSWGTTVKAVLPLRSEDNNGSSHPFGR